MKKLLIPLPYSLEGIIESIPFLQRISANFREDQINVLMNEKFMDMQMVLPGNLTFYPISFDDQKTVMDIHRYAYNLNEVFNIDLSFSLEPKLKNSSYGWMFKAKERVGFKHGPWQYFNQKKYIIESNNPSSYNRILLLSKYLDKEIEFEKVLGPRLEPYFRKEKDRDGYIVLALQHDSFSLEKMRELIELFDKETFILIGSEEDIESNYDITIEQDKRNLFDNLAGKTSFFQMMQILSHSKGLITSHTGIANLGAFFGTETILLEDSEFVADHSIDTSHLVHPYERVRFENNIDEVLEKIYTQFRLK